MSAALEAPVASAVAALVSVFAALVSVFAALVSVFAALVSVYIADAHFLDAASAAVVVAAEAAAVGAAELAGYGRPGGAGSTLVGPNLHLRVKKLASRLMRPVTRPLAHRRRRVQAIATRRHLPSPQKAEALGKSRS